MSKYSNNQRAELFLFVFLFGLSNILSCTQNRKTGIEGSGNSNNQVIIADNIENVTINRASNRLTSIPNNFSETLSIGMNPEIVADRLGPPKQKSPIDVYFIDSNEKLECTSWYYSFDDVRMRFDISNDQVIAYTLELKIFPKDDKRIFPVELFCSKIYLGKTTFGEASDLAEKSFVNQIQFGNYRDWVLLGRFVYPPVCSRHSRNRASTAYFASTDFDADVYDTVDWDGNGMYDDNQDLPYRHQVITSVTITGNNFTSREFGFHLSPVHEL